MRKPLSGPSYTELYDDYLRSNEEWHRWYAIQIATLLPLVQIARFAAQLAKEPGCGELSVQFCEFVEATMPQEVKAERNGSSAARNH